MRFGQRASEGRRQVMVRSAILSGAILALSFTAPASAQAIYVDQYPTFVAPERGSVVRETVVTPPPIVRERIIINRPAYVPAPVLPSPRYGYEERYVVTDW